MAARLIICYMPVGIDQQSLGILIGQPLGRRCSRSAEYHLDAVGSESRYGAIKEAEVKLPLLGLHQGPGEFADADDVDSAFLHTAGVLLPIGFRPLLGGGCGSEEGRIVSAGGAALCPRREAISPVFWEMDVFGRLLFAWRLKKK